MPNRHIAVNIDKTISFATGMGITQDPVPRRPLASSLKPANKRLGCPPPPLYKHQVIYFRIQYPQLSLCWMLRARAASVSHGVSRRGLFFVSHDTPKRQFDSKNDKEI